MKTCATKPPYRQGHTLSRLQDSGRVLLSTAQLQEYRQTSLALQRANYIVDELVLALYRRYPDQRECRRIRSLIKSRIRWMNLLIEKCEDVVAYSAEEVPEVIRLIITAACPDCIRKPSAVHSRRDHGESEESQELRPDPVWRAQLESVLSNVERVISYLFARSDPSLDLDEVPDCLRAVKYILLRQRKHLATMSVEDTKIEVINKADDDRCSECRKPLEP